MFGKKFGGLGVQYMMRGFRQADFDQAVTETLLQSGGVSRYPDCLTKGHHFNLNSSKWKTIELFLILKKQVNSNHRETYLLVARTNVYEGQEQWDVPFSR